MFRKNFLFFVLLFVFNVTHAQQIVTGFKAQQKFALTYWNRNLKNIPDQLCRMPKERKTAMCESIFIDPYFFEYFEVYLNMVGIINNQSDHLCIKRRVTSDIVQNILPQLQLQHDMFPCFGRHYPVRSRWNLDDYYNTFYLSEGPTPDSAFIFVRELYPRSEKYIVYGLMTFDVPVYDLPPVNFSQEALNYELDSLNKWSYNGNMKEVEVLYIRNLYFSSYQIHDKICNFSIEQKIELCYSILSKNVFRDLYWELKEDIFRNFGSPCIEDKILFHYFSEYNDLVVPQKMLPCYGYDVGRRFDYPDVVHTMLYISGGFRDNSVLVYNTYGSNRCSLLEFIENVKLDDISGDDYRIIDNGNGPVPSALPGPELIKSSQEENKIHVS